MNSKVYQSRRQTREAYDFFGLWRGLNVMVFILAEHPLRVNHSPKIGKQPPFAREGIPGRSQFEKESHFILRHDAILDLLQRIEVFRFPALGAKLIDGMAAPATGRGDIIDDGQFTGSVEFRGKHAA